MPAARTLKRQTASAAATPTHTRTHAHTHAHARARARYAKETAYTYSRFNISAVLAEHAFTTDTTEGWGLTSNVTHLIGSDGSNVLYLWQPGSFAPAGRVECWFRSVLAPLARRGRCHS